MLHDFPGHIYKWSSTTFTLSSKSHPCFIPTIILNKFQCLNVTKDEIAYICSYIWIMNTKALRVRGISLRLASIAHKTLFALPIWMSLWWIPPLLAFDQKVTSIFGCLRNSRGFFFLINNWKMQHKLKYRNFCIWSI